MTKSTKKTNQGLSNKAVMKLRENQMITESKIIQIYKENINKEQKGPGSRQPPFLVLFECPYWCTDKLKLNTTQLLSINGFLLL